MKKRSLSFLFILVLVLALIVPTGAIDSTSDPSMTTCETIYLEDGSYITTVLIEENTYEGDSLTRTTSLTKKGSKTVTCHSSEGHVRWEYTLTGNFTVVQGVSAVCTSASYTYTIYDSDWSFSNGSATKSSNVAYGAGTFKQKFLFITIETAIIDISITCDVKGNLS